MVTQSLLTRVSFKSMSFLPVRHRGPLNRASAVVGFVQIHVQSSKSPFRYKRLFASILFSLLFCLINYILLPSIFITGYKVQNYQLDSTTKLISWTYFEVPYNDSIVDILMFDWARDWTLKPQWSSKIEVIFEIKPISFFFFPSVLDMVYQKVLAIHTFHREILKHIV